ncbi:hypothetical protein PG985_011884 [Apiospora marii]|uniref:uncharacterized protein n=1 Tax=Apiospora marii TaxID=335849 RepID=UPI0031319571
MGRPPLRNIPDQGGQVIANLMRRLRGIQFRRIEDQPLAGGAVVHHLELVQHPASHRAHEGLGAGEVPGVVVHHGAGVVAMHHPPHPIAGRRRQLAGRVVAARLVRADAALGAVPAGVVAVEGVRAGGQVVVDVGRAPGGIGQEAVAVGAEVQGALDGAGFFQPFIEEPGLSGLGDSPHGKTLIYFRPGVWRV